ncbi:coniferyl alcohol acyltransferase-like [Alnus glutinosa]|uniref:coniferyl alcohol acyltransferase-like n=1 Tax=Alnus glutinosa TaxID=3517 RepID=UPI002D79F871|nr:coniferyl alcohol acyltransferase-like [Alnus glutinosa]
MATSSPLPVKMDGKTITCRARDILIHKSPKMPMSSKLKVQNGPFKQNKRTVGRLRPPLIVGVTNFGFYFYRTPLLNNFTAIVDILKSSLAETLNHYYPFAGRIVQNPYTGEPEIFCDNIGALVVEAQANIPLKELKFYNLNQSLQGKLVSISTNFPVQIQVTKYTCGGISITFTFDHALGNASFISSSMICLHGFHVCVSSLQVL